MPPLRVGQRLGLAVLDQRSGGPEQVNGLPQRGRACNSKYGFVRRLQHSLRLAGRMQREERRVLRAQLFELLNRHRRPVPGQLRPQVTPVGVADGHQGGICGAVTGEQEPAKERVTRGHAPTVVVRHPVSDPVHEYERHQDLLLPHLLLPTPCIRRFVDSVNPQEPPRFGTPCGRGSEPRGRPQRRKEQG